MHSRHFPENEHTGIYPQTFLPFVKQTQELMLELQLFPWKKALDFTSALLWLLHRLTDPLCWPQHSSQSSSPADNWSGKGLHHSVERTKWTSALCYKAFLFLLVFHIMHTTCQFNSKNNILSQQLPGKNKRWKIQENVFPWDEIVQEKLLDNSQPGFHMLAGKAVITFLGNLKDNRYEMLRIRPSNNRYSINDGG